MARACYRSLYDTTLTRNETILRDALHKSIMGGRGKAPAFKKIRSSDIDHALFEHKTTLAELMPPHLFE